MSLDVPAAVILNDGVRATVSLMDSGATVVEFSEGTQATVEIAATELADVTLTANV